MARDWSATADQRLQEAQAAVKAAAAARAKERRERPGTKEARAAEYQKSKKRKKTLDDLGDEERETFLEEEKAARKAHRGTLTKGRTEEELEEVAQSRLATRRVRTYLPSLPWIVTCNETSRKS